MLFNDDNSASETKIIPINEILFMTLLHMYNIHIFCSVVHIEYF